MPYKSLVFLNNYIVPYQDIIVRNSSSDMDFLSTLAEKHAHETEQVSDLIYTDQMNSGLRFSGSWSTHSGIFGGPLGHGPLWQTKIFFTIGNNKKTWFDPPPLCVITSGQQKFDPLYENPKYATEYMAWSNKLSVKTILKYRHNTW